MSRLRLKGAAFTQKMNAAKERKARESQRFPERQQRPARHHAGPQLEGPKMDGRWMKETPRADPTTDLITRNMRKLGLVKDEPAPAAPAGAPDEKKPDQSAQSARQFPRAHKPLPAPVVPPKKGVLATVVPPPTNKAS